LDVKRSGIFALIAAVLGFVVDLIGLATFIAQAAHRPIVKGVMTFPRVWAILLLIYGWFVVSCVMAQWRITAEARKKEAGKRSSPFSSLSREPLRPSFIVVLSVIAMGVLLLPIAVMIGYDIQTTASAPHSVEAQDFIGVLFGSLVSMALVGFGVFVAIMAALELLNHDVEFS